MQLSVFDCLEKMFCRFFIFQEYTLGIIISSGHTTYSNFQSIERRIVLAEGEDAPEHAVKAKNSCMPMRVAIEPAPGTNE